VSALGMSRVLGDDHLLCARLEVSDQLGREDGSGGGCLRVGECDRDLNIKLRCAWSFASVLILCAHCDEFVEVRIKEVGFFLK
jgi:hypothetical protein